MIFQHWELAVRANYLQQLCGLISILKRKVAYLRYATFILESKGPIWQIGPKEAISQRISVFSINLLGAKKSYLSPFAHQQHNLRHYLKCVHA